MTTALFGSSKTMEKDLDLVVLTSDTLLQCVKASFYLLRLLTLQLNDRPAIKADPFVHIKDLALLFVDSNADVLLHVMDGLETILQPVKPHVKCRNSIVEVIIFCRHGGLQLPVMLSGGPNLVDQASPDITQHPDSLVSLSGIDVELPRESDNLSHPPDQTLTLVRSALVIRIIQLTNAVAKRIA